MRRTFWAVLIVVTSLIIVPCFPIRAATRQSGPDTSLVGSWLGTIDASEIKMRVVFHIVASPDRALTGTMDIPERGLKGIPLSLVQGRGRSVHFEVAYLGSYDGRISEGGSLIEGVWSGNGISFPITLRPTTEVIAFRAIHDYAIEQVVLDLRSRTRHFEFHFSSPDHSAISDLGKELSVAYMVRYLLSEQLPHLREPPLTSELGINK